MPNEQASPAPLMISGKQFSMHPFTDKDIGEINNFLKAQIITTASDSALPGMPQMVVDSIMKAAMELTTKIDWLANPGQVETIPAMLYMFWVSIRRGSTITRQEFGDLMILEWDANFKRGMETLKLVNPTLLGVTEPAEKQVEETPLADENSTTS